MTTFIQTMRRLGQQMDGWNRAIDMQATQYKLARKLFVRYKLELRMTCPACPEQYDVFDDCGSKVGYFRLRHGVFTVDVPDCGGETIYEAYPNGDGIFDDNERLIFLAKALRKLIEIEKTKS